MMTWDGLWGEDVESQYQHQSHDDQRRLQPQAFPPAYTKEGEDEGERPLVYDSIRYNRNSVLAITPKALLPMIVSQVTNERSQLNYCNTAPQRDT